MSDVTRLRVGTGFDVHAFEEGGRLVLAGVEVPHTHGLVGHSDADLIAHAVTDALLGGAGLADIGEYFPAEAVAAGADSMGLLGQIVDLLDERGCEIINVDCVVAMQSPKLAPHRDAMRTNLAKVLRADVDRVTVRASTTDHLGFIGRREGAAAIATCLVLRGA
ncbi:MAG: 2-C-methyl-D-erythritol 2,4-cyclodiphosphate synthase [Thermoleophilia bacterium]|nr:2-C-methyl-D-erythritol 2,4-cyclodiphosphate synthase [Thermoleophilia bacterium]